MDAFRTRRAMVGVALGLAVTACGAGAGEFAPDVTTDPSSVTTTPATTVPADSAVASETTLPSESAAPALPIVSVLGPEEFVFTWSADRCDDAMRPDLPVRAFRTDDGSINVTLSDPENFRLVGTDFDSLVPQCPAMRTSTVDPDPAAYDFLQWFGATYTEDGRTIHGIIHNEFHGAEAIGWIAERDFSTTEPGDWAYLGRSADGVFPLDSLGDMWVAGDSLCQVTSWGAHPDAWCDAIRRWTAPREGTVTVVVSAADLGAGGGNGVEVRLEHGGEDVWAATIEEGDTDRRREVVEVAVAPGDHLDFSVSARGDAAFDATEFSVELDYGRPCTGPAADCNQMSLTSTVSHDGGATWSATDGADDLVATVPVPYVADEGFVGIWQPSNIVKHPEDGMYYMLVQHDFHRDGIDIQGTCLIRTPTLDDPAAWRAWDGVGFEMQFLDPYTNPDLDPDEHTCPSVVQAPISSLTYSTELGRFVAIASYDRTPVGYYLLTSEDLVSWSRPVLIAEARFVWTHGSQTPYEAYPTLIDHDSDALSFDTVGEFPYLYYSRFNSLDPRDYDLIRIPIHIEG